MKITDENEFVKGAQRIKGRSTNALIDFKDRAEMVSLECLKLLLSI